MQTQHDIDKFDAAEWLARWTAAGGGYAGRHLLISSPRSPVLQKMIRDLAFDEIIALAEAMGVGAEEAA